MQPCYLGECVSVRLVSNNLPRHLPGVDHLWIRSLKIRLMIIISQHPYNHLAQIYDALRVSILRIYFLCNMLLLGVAVCCGDVDQGLG